MNTAQPPLPAAARPAAPAEKPIAVRRSVSRDYLLAGALVFLLCFTAILAGRAWALREERANATRQAPTMSYQRDLGVVLARATIAEPQVLPVYGSSELQLPIRNRVSDFFRNQPDGFRVCALGRRGVASLNMLEKIASAGRPANGKAVLLLSPVWFLSNGATFTIHAGNFSPLQALETLYRAPLDAGLRRDLAARMGHFTNTLERSPILKAGVNAAARHGVAGALELALLRPLGLGEIEVMELQDHAQSLQEMRDLQAHPAWAAPAAETGSNGTLDWAAFIARASAEAPPITENPPGTTGEDPVTIWHGVTEMAASDEWLDLELLLRTCREMRIRPLILNIPWYAPFFDQRGVSAGVRDGYYSRLRTLAAKYDMPLVTFQSHEYDHNFLRDRNSHLSEKGWIYFDHNIDAYWYDRPLPDR